MSSAEGFYQQLLQRLTALRNRQKHISLALGVVQLLIFALLLLTLVVFSEALLHFSAGFRTVLAYLFITIIASGVFWYVGRPLYSRFLRRSYPNDISVALLVGSHYQNVRDRLADALQVFQRRKANKENYSPELADASLAEVWNETQKLDFKAVATIEPIKKSGKLLAYVFAGVAVLFLIFTKDFSTAAIRLLNPSVDFSDLADLRIDVSPGDVQIVKGEDLNIVALFSQPYRSRVSLFIKNKESELFDRVDFPVTADSSVSMTLEKISQEKRYYVATEMHRSAEFKIDVIERPLVRHLQLRLNYPKYSKLSNQLLDENVGDVSALKGTNVELSLQANKALSSAKLIFNDGTEQGLMAADRNARGHFKLTHSESYHIELFDSDSLKNSEPIEYKLSVVTDQYPTVRITFPGQDVDLNKDMHLPLVVEAEDDFGVSGIHLFYSVVNFDFEERAAQFLELPVNPGAKDKLLLNYSWDLSRLNLAPEDIVSYYAEVADNDIVSGPKKTKSATFRVRFPSIYEIYDEAEQTHEDTYEDFKEVYEETRELKESLDEIVQQMKKDPELNWEEKQKVQEAAKAQKDVQQQLESAQEKLDEMIDRMEQNELMSVETLEKYRELQSLIQEVLSEEMRETLAKLQQSMEDIDPKELKTAMEDLQANQEDFLKSMERTLNLLKKLQMEQKLDESLRKAQDLLRRQNELNEKASESGSAQDRQKYAEEQNRIKQDTNELSESLQDLADKMSEFPQMPVQKVQDAQSQLTEGQLPRKMQEASEQFQSGQMQSAQDKGQEISEGLQELLSSLESAQKELSEQEKQRIMQAMKRSSHDLLQLSMQQEQLTESTKGADRNTPGLGEMADAQQNLMSGLNRVTSQLYDLAQSTFFVTPEMGKALGKAMKGMQESMSGLEARNPGKSSKAQTEAMSGMNEAAAQLRQSMQGMSGASSGIGFQEMMQRMMGLSGQQEGINQQTQNMVGGQQGGLSMEQQAAMQKLATQQNAVRKSLEQLMKEAGSRSDLMGDLGKVGEDMEEVVKEMMQQKVNRQTVNRQKKILSRLLDAQRSMHDRDLSKKRKAETAKLYQTISPAALNENPGQKSERLRNELLKALKEGYSKDYKALIEKYFQALSAENDAGSKN